MNSGDIAEFSRVGIDDYARQDSRIAIAAFVVIAALMVALFPFPPLLDYPNHYTRMWLIAGGIREAPFPQIYALDWNHAFTNLGIDLLAHFVGPLIGVPALAKILLFLAIVLPPLGAIALHRTLFGPTYWQIAILYLAWCATLIGGFINFQIGLGLALIFAVVDLKLQNSNRGLLFVWRLLAALLLTLMHVFSLGFYMALICGIEFSGRFDLGRTRQAWGSLALRLAVALATCASVPLAMFLRAPVLPTGNAGNAFWNSTPAMQIRNLLSAIWTYTAPIDILFLIPIALVISNAIRTSRFRMHAGLAIAAIGLLLLSIASPRAMMGTGWISWRFPIMAALAAMAMSCPLPNLPRRSALLVALALSTAVFARTAWIGYNWWQGSKDSSDVIAILADIPAGAAIFPVEHMVAADPMGKWQRHYAWGEDTFRHLPTLAAPISHGFTPNVFTARGKQPLVVMPPWSDIAVPEGNLPSTAVLTCPKWFDEETYFSPYLSVWRKRFDYLLVVNAGEPDQFVGETLPAGLKLISERPFARLYAIEKDTTLPERPDSSMPCPPTPYGSQ